MPEFKIHCGYSMKNKTKFYNDQEPQEYHYFITYNHQIIPKEYLAERKDIPCFIIIPNSLIKRSKIDLEEILRKGSRFNFILNLGEKKTAKFNTNNRNWLVLKTKEYWENAVKKIGFWDRKDYFYEVDKKKNQPKSTNQPTSNQPTKNIWIKITLICLPFLILGLLFLIIVRWINKRKY
ncbi:MAG: hypothetical protein MRERC_3c121 [Mycoplasmataceae bacterium RC_NB112A]|nr:MAG: hypothetical protein MRERC_3c121 [Mycoplasmataceae bacterium RC_NB112A]